MHKASKGFTAMKDDLFNCKQVSSRWFLANTSATHLHYAEYVIQLFFLNACPDDECQGNVFLTKGCIWPPELLYGGALLAVRKGDITILSYCSRTHVKGEDNK
jgi:hypothetical protein